MQKVVYWVSKVNKDEKLKGVGYLIDGNLLIPTTLSKGNAYIRVFEDVAKKCRKVDDTDNEFKGYVTIAYKNVNIYNKEKNRYDTLDYVLSFALPILLHSSFPIRYIPLRYCFLVLSLFFLQFISLKKH